jgi:proline dehydrogenase
MIWLNNLIAQLLPLVPKPVVKIVAKQYIAGETLEEALTKSQELNRNDLGVTLDLLGEDPGGKDDCLRALLVYKRAIELIHSKGLKAGISLKPSHMGLKLDKDFCLANIATLVKLAGKHGIFVRIDMEDTSLCPATMDLFLTLQDQFSNVGIVIQAYLRRSINDINLLMEKGANIRLCKGAYYWEKRGDVYKDPDIINSSYTYLLEKLLSGGCFVGIATHDEKLVFQSLALIDRIGPPKGSYEFQMLFGVEDELRQILVSHGHPVRVYLPFGKEWFAYSLRRLKENPRMVGYILANPATFLKALFKK